MTVGTAFLWWTYIGFKTTLDRHEDLGVPLLEVDINSELAFLTFAVIASCLTVSTLATAELSGLPPSLLFPRTAPLA